MSNVLFIPFLSSWIDVSDHPDPNHNALHMTSALSSFFLAFSTFTTFILCMLFARHDGYRCTLGDSQRELGNPKSFFPLLEMNATVVPLNNYVTEISTAGHDVSVPLWRKTSELPSADSAVITEGTSSPPPVAWCSLLGSECFFIFNQTLILLTSCIVFAVLRWHLSRLSSFGFDTPFATPAYVVWMAFLKLSSAIFQKIYLNACYWLSAEELLHFADRKNMILHCIFSHVLS